MPCRYYFVYQLYRQRGHSLKCPYLQHVDFANIAYKKPFKILSDPNFKLPHRESLGSGTEEESADYVVFHELYFSGISQLQNTLQNVAFVFPLWLTP